MKLVGNIEQFLSFPQNVCRVAIVHHRRRKQAQAGMAMLLVVPAKKSLTESSAILNAPETVRELRPILQGAELAFRVRIVVRNVRPTMRFWSLPDRPAKTPPVWNSSRCRDRHAA